MFVLPLNANGKEFVSPILVPIEEYEDGMAAIDAGAILGEALKMDAEEIIVAHNHSVGI